MMITTTQRQIVREAEKDLDAAQTALDAAEADLAMVERRWGLESGWYRLAYRYLDRAWATLAAASENLEKTCLEEEN